MGSSLALYNYLLNAGVRSRMISPTDYADFLHWMPGHEEVWIYPERMDECQALIAEAEWIFCLDFNALGRVNELADALEASPARKVLIDHHRDPQDFDDERFCSIEASSTCELMYEYIHRYLNEDLIDDHTAQCIYTGLVTDTGSFRYDSTTSNTIRVAAELLDHGARPSVIYDKIFDQNRLERLQLLGYFLMHKIEVIEDGRVALATLTLEELNRYNVITGDTEGFVNYGLSISGVEMSALFIDRGPLVKISFRSKGDFECNRFAAMHFSGGGHKNAAGGSSRQSLEAAVETFREVVGKHLKEM